MNAKNNRITNDLYWVALRYRFYNLEMLKQAIADGTLHTMIQSCADNMYEGNFKLAVDALRKNLSSQKVNMAKATYVPIEAKDDWTRYELLWEYTGKLAESVRPTIANLPADTKAKARWQLTREDIDCIAKDDFKTLDSIYQNMMSKKSKKPEVIEESIGMKEFLDRLDYVSKLRSAAEAATKVASAQLQISEAIMSKLSKGSKITLSADEAAELSKLFNR